MPENLAAKTVTVIGATQGTGYEAVRILLAEGANVKIFARDPEKARERLGGSVEVVSGDLRDPAGMPEALAGADHLIFTAGVTKRPCKEELIVSTEFEGMKKTLSAAKETGFGGRIVFLSSMGVTHSNWASRLLNKVKGNALVWRKAIEDLIRDSGFDYTIVRAGYLMNSSSENDIELSQKEHPLEFRYRIGRKETARVMVESLRQQAASKKTFDAFRSRTNSGSDWLQKFERLSADLQIDL